MSVTFPIILFGRNAVIVKEDSGFSTGDSQPFSDPDDLKNNTVWTKPIATYEPDFWVLDGNYKFKPDSNVHVGWMTETQSTSNSDFSVLPEIAITFDSIHSTNGLTLYFSEFTGDWADSLQIRFYNSVGGLIRSDNYTPTSAVFSTGQAVTDFKRIEITIISMNKAYRYMRLKGIDFDTLTTFAGASIKTAELLEQIDPIANELPFDTLDFTLHSDDADFSIVAPSGAYATLQEKEPVEVYENINGEPIYIGRFYLEKWESKSEAEAGFNAFDAIGLLDSITFVGGIYLDASHINNFKTSDEVIDDIFTAAGLSYDLDASLEDIQLYGWIPYSTCREALRYVCFAIGAYATCSRAGVVQIKPMELASDLEAFDFTLTAAEKGQSQSLSLKPLITGVEIIAHNYYEQTDPDYVVRTIYDDDIETGDTTFIFGAPIYGLVIIEADTTITATYDYSDNHMVVRCTVAGHLHVIGYDYVEVKRVTGVYNGSLTVGTTEKVIRIEDATLIGTHNVADTTQRVYDYYQQRNLQKVRLYVPAEAVGDSVLIDTQSSRQIGGIVEKMSIDLGRGFVADAEITGVVIPL